MSNPHWDRTKAIFGEASELGDAERAAYLQRACATDAPLRQRVEALLAAADGAGEFLRDPTINEFKVAPAGNLASNPIGETVGDSIGPYRLLEVIGRGGFGTVFLAEQQHPVRRRVALKIVSPGMDTRQVIARFEAERQALALMEHPGIARVFDGGATPGGRPYFAMELVRGLPLTEYCDTHGLDTPQRLALFISVCHAVQHAHQRGIIHRDLKPSNILVTHVDGLPQPKVIDFGIAKALSGNLTDRTLHTEFRSMLGTPAYMSPEQADPSGDEADTRSDVFALGVLLYELLTGTTPLDQRSISTATMAELKRLIKEVDPPKPSTRAASLSRSGARRTDATALARSLRGDLDWIVLKCLGKRPSRRYDTVGLLAADIQRHLHHEPVLARPPSAPYRASKFVRRHRFTVALAAAVALTAAAGLALAGVQFASALRERAAAVASAAVARSEADKASAVRAFLQDMLAAVQPDQAQGNRDVTVAEALDAAAKRLSEGNFADKPAVEAAIRQTLGTTYTQIGRLPEGERQLRAAINAASHAGDEALATIEAAYSSLSSNLVQQEKHADAEAAARASLERITARLGPDAAEAATALNNIAGCIPDGLRDEEKEALYRRAVDIRLRTLGEQNLETAGTMNNLGFCLATRSKSTEAIGWFQRSIAIRRAMNKLDSAAIFPMMNLAAMLVDERPPRLAEAEPLAREAIDIAHRFFGEQHPSLISMYNLFTYVLDRCGKADEALAASDKGLSMARALLEPTQPRLVLMTQNYAGKLVEAGRHAEAEPLLLEAIAKRRTIHAGKAHEALAKPLADLGRLLLATNRPAEAEAALREALDLYRQLDGDRAYTIAMIGSDLGAALLAGGRTDEALPLLTVAAEAALAEKPINARRRVAIGRAMDALRGMGRAAEAEALAARLAQVDKP